MFEEDDDAVDVFLRQPPWSRFLCPLKSGDFFLAPEREMIVVIMTKEDVINHGEDNRGKQDWLTSLTTSSRPGS